MANIEKRLEALEKARTLNHPLAEVLVDLAGIIDPDGWRGDEGEIVPRIKGENDDALRGRVAGAITAKYDLAELLGLVIGRLPG